MSEYEQHNPDERLAAELRELYAAPRAPVGAVDRVLDAVRGDRGASSRDSRHWLSAGLRRVSVVVLAAAAGLVLFAGGIVTDRLMRHDSPGASSGMVAAVSEPDSARDITFVFAAPNAHDVALVGDFNGWNRHGAKLVRNVAGDWQIHVRVPTGLHMYAFVVDGSTWVADPLAPRGADDDYGVASSTILVGAGARPAAAPRS
jgi:hypothetical protein